MGKTKLVAQLLVMALCLCMISVPAFADETDAGVISIEKEQSEYQPERIIPETDELLENDTVAVPDEADAAVVKLTIDKAL